MLIFAICFARGGPFYETELKKQEAKLQGLGVTVVGAIADNTASVQMGVRLSSGLDLNCHAHVLILLIAEIGSLFEAHFEQAEEVEHYYFHPKQRGEKLSVEEWRLTLISVSESECSRSPSYGHVGIFRKKGGIFRKLFRKRLKTSQCPFFLSVYSDNPLSPLGRNLGSLPPTTGTVERAFGCADWLSSDRARLSTVKLFCEVYIHLSTRALQKESGFSLRKCPP